MNTRIRAATLGGAIALALLCASNVSAADPSSAPPGSGGNAPHFPEYPWIARPRGVAGD